MPVKATAVFEADDKRFSSAVENINRKMLNLQRNVARLAIGWTLLKKGAELIGKGAEGFAAAVDAGAKLQHLSFNTGIAVQDLQVLQHQFVLAGKSAEDVGPTMAKMMKGLTTGSAANTIKKLGLDMEKLRKQTPSDQFTAIGKAIKALPDPAQRATAAMEIFGKSGASLLSVFEGGSFEKAAAMVGSQAEILARDAALFEDVTGKLNLAGLKVQGFFVGVADKVAPVLQPMLDKFAGMDFAELGQQLGDILATFIQAFNDDTLGDIMLTSMKISFANAANFLMGLLLGLGDTLVQILIETAKLFLSALQIAGTADFWIGLGAALLAVAAKFGAAIIDVVADMIDWLGSIPLIGDSIHEGAESMRARNAEVRKGSDQLLDYGGEKLQAGFDALANDFFESIQNIAEVPGKGFDTGMSLIDTGEMNDHMDTLIGNAMENAQRAHVQALKDLPTKTPAAPLGEDSEGKPVFSRLQKIGGGGYGAGGDPLLSESRQQTRELRELNRGIKSLIDKQPRLTPGTLVPVFT